MTVNGNRRWMLLDYKADSLYSVIADGQSRNTTAGRENWKSLIAGSFLQSYCNYESFNINFINPPNFSLRARLGLVANNQDNCLSCDSWIGFGVHWRSNCKTSEAFRACGNAFLCGNNVVDNPAFGYILVH
jgi:hypothetical protein